MMSVFKPNTSAENISYIENRNVDLELEIHKRFGMRNKYEIKQMHCRRKLTL